MDDANHPGLILVPRVEDAVEWTDLDEASQLQLNAEINQACRALQVFRPHKLNVAALGNLVSQLHVHVIARFEDDIAWPRPVWGTATAKPYSPESLRSEEHTSELQSLMRISYAVFCLKKKT